MKNKDCELVKDLLPSYVDGLTSDETNEFIESHVKECPECKALLNDMKSCQWNNLLSQRNLLSLQKNIRKNYEF